MRRSAVRKTAGYSYVQAPVIGPSSDFPDWQCLSCFVSDWRCGSSGTEGDCGSSCRVLADWRASRFLEMADGVAQGLVRGEKMDRDRRADRGAREERGEDGGWRWKGEGDDIHGDSGRSWTVTFLGRRAESRDTRAGKLRGRDFENAKRWKAATAPVVFWRAGAGAWYNPSFVSLSERRGARSFSSPVRPFLR